MAPPTVVPGMIDGLAALLGSLLVGGLGIAAGTQLVAGDGDLVRATITAGIGALVWAFLDGIPLLGPVIALLAWIGVLQVRHDTGWGGAAVAGFVAWIVAGVLAIVLSAIGLPVTEVVGVPGV
ncbi:hypothetical protein [Halanaeroarchaeum sp. HSR-CO]|uniref:hypothetical protein n=1 Tax=Halanaeroarchaeum sp. HSR-CO TaxID=2866382 RepID=UPI00217D5407|nr:hypothetical protein [Halanaeroarchaeum sp. HSR-CO]